MGMLRNTRDGDRHLFALSTDGSYVTVPKELFEPIVVNDERIMKVSHLNPNKTSDQDLLADFACVNVFGSVGLPPVHQFDDGTLAGDEGQGWRLDPDTYDLLLQRWRSVLRRSWSATVVEDHVVGVRVPTTTEDRKLLRICHRQNLVLRGLWNSEAS